MRMATAAAARCFMRAGAAHDMVEVGFAALRAHTIVAIDHCPGACAVDGRRDRGSLGDCAKRSRTRASRSISRSLRRERPRHRRARLRATRRHPHSRARAPCRTGAVARVTRHGELVAQTAAAGGDHGTRASRAARPGHFCRRPRAGEDTLARLVCEQPARRNRSPTCLPESARSPCGLPKAPASPQWTATRRRSQRCSRRPLRRPA